MGLQQVTAAADPVVTLEQAKAHCSIEGDDWDDLLGLYIQAATAEAEQFLDRSLAPQTWLLTLDDFCGDAITLPMGPVTNVDSIVYLDDDRVQRTLSPAIYIEDLISDPQRVVLDPDQSWPNTADLPNGVKITFTTGFMAVPANAKLAILQAVATWFGNREAGPMPDSALALLRKLRRVSI